MQINQRPAFLTSSSAPNFVPTALTSIPTASTPTSQPPSHLSPLIFPSKHPSMQTASNASTSSLHMRPTASSSFNLASPSPPKPCPQTQITRSPSSQLLLTNTRNPNIPQFNNVETSQGVNSNLHTKHHYAPSTSQPSSSKSFNTYSPTFSFANYSYPNKPPSYFPSQAQQPTKAPKFSESTVYTTSNYIRPSRSSPASPNTKPVNPYRSDQTLKSLCSRVAVLNTPDPHLHSGSKNGQRISRSLSSASKKGYDTFPHEDRKLITSLDSNDILGPTGNWMEGSMSQPCIAAPGIKSKSIQFGIEGKIHSRSVTSENSQNNSYDHRLNGHRSIKTEKQFCKEVETPRFPKNMKSSNWTAAGDFKGSPVLLFPSACDKQFQFEGGVDIVEDRNGHGSQGTTKHYVGSATGILEAVCSMNGCDDKGGPLDSCLLGRADENQREDGITDTNTSLECIMSLVAAECRLTGSEYRSLVAALHMNFIRTHEALKIAIKSNLLYKIMHPTLADAIYDRIMPHGTSCGKAINGVRHSSGGRKSRNCTGKENYLVARRNTPTWNGNCHSNKGSNNNSSNDSNPGSCDNGNDNSNDNGNITSYATFGNGKNCGKSSSNCKDGNCKDSNPNNNDNNCNNDNIGNDKNNNDNNGKSSSNNNNNNNNNNNGPKKDPTLALESESKKSKSTQTSATTSASGSSDDKNKETNDPHKKQNPLRSLSGKGLGPIVSSFEKSKKVEFDSMKGWIVENVIGEEITVANAQMRDNVCIRDCNLNCVVDVPKKVNNVWIDKCGQTSVILTSILGSVEIINCDKIKLTINGRCPNITIDKSNAIAIFLGSESRDVVITTSKSSEMNVSIAKDDDKNDSVEIPIPEQFVSEFEGNGLVTRPASWYG